MPEPRDTAIAGVRQSRDEEEYKQARSRREYKQWRKMLKVGLESAYRGVRHCAKRRNRWLLSCFGQQYFRLLS